MWLKENFDIEKIALGVDEDNRAAIKAYEKSGFKKSSCCFKNQTMELKLG